VNKLPVLILKCERERNNRGGVGGSKSKKIKVREAMQRGITVIKRIDN